MFLYSKMGGRPPPHTPLLRIKPKEKLSYMSSNSVETGIMYGLNLLSLTKLFVLKSRYTVIKVVAGRLIG